MTLQRSISTRLGRPGCALNGVYITKHLAIQSNGKDRLLETAAMPPSESSLSSCLS
jgi:hypothetical protein